MTTVAYLGPPGTFNDAALQRLRTDARTAPLFGGAHTDAVPAVTPDEALAMAYGMVGADARVVVIPDGVSVLAVREEKET